MPNIIEQQDLLKGLPDARLAMLLQYPVADIPPFLVAAEALRRQSIREQVASETPKESVVDTLTKQIANVPQNISAPMQPPPNVPPTPPMQGVMALQQQQAMADIAQQAQPQMMRGGGMVQRYQYGGQVQPWWTIPDISGPLMGVRDYVGEKASDLYDWATRPYSERAEEKTSDVLPQLDVMTPEELADFNASVSLPDVAVGGKQPAPPKPRPRPDDLTKPKPGETEDEFRARLEALYAAPELSDWERAQKWFAMSEQFLDPSKTTMQSIAGAGQAFAQSAAEQARAQREAEIAREKAMLEYDMGLAAERRAAAQAERERTTFSAKDQADILVKSSESLARMISEKERQVAEMTSDPMTAQMDPTLNTRVDALKKEIDDLYTRKSQVDGSLSTLGELAYGPIPFDTYSLNSGFGTR